MPNELARDIRQARLERGWAPYDLAEAVRRHGPAATVGDVARWETGGTIGKRTERALRRGLGLEATP